MAFWEDVLRLPVRILCVGGTVLLLFLFARWVRLPGIDAFTDAKLDTGVSSTIIAILVLGVGVALAVFLWWLSARFFRLIESGKLDTAGLSGIKDLPMGLPEGTVRALLALIVAVVGLPILLFSQVLTVDPAIAGYMNGIITGVFGFYFGTRTTGVPTQAVTAITDAQAQVQRKTEEVNRAQAAAENSQAEAAAAVKQAGQAMEEVAGTKAAATQRIEEVAGFDMTLAKLNRHLGLARTVLQVFGPALPDGMLPKGLADVIGKAESAVAAVQGVRAQDARPDQIAGLVEAVSAITGQTSPLGALLGKASPLLVNLLPAGLALGPAAGLAAVIGLGVKLGSSQFQRWRARVLAAPLAQGLVEFGTLTPELVHSALRQSPKLSAALANQPPAIVDAALADAVLRDNGDDLLFAAYGPQGTVAPVFADMQQVNDGLEELRQAVLSLYSANDVPEATVKDVAGTLAKAGNAALADGGSQAALLALTQADANRLIGAVGKVSARAEAPVEQRAALDALVTLVDFARRDNIDLATAITEVTS